MPIFEFSSDGNLRQFDRDIFLATVTYPQEGDRKLRDRLLELERAGRLDIELHPFPPEIGHLEERVKRLLKRSAEKRALEMLPFLMKTPSSDECIILAVRNARHAWLSSVVFSLLVSCSQFHPEVDVNVETAICAIAEILSLAPTTGPRPVTTEEGVRKHWKKFRTVSHYYFALWHLAIRVPGLVRLPQSMPSGCSVSSLVPVAQWLVKIEHDNVFQVVLGLAEDYRQLGIEHGFLRGNDLWRVSDELANDLPRSGPNQRLGFPLGEPVLSILRRLSPTCQEDVLGS